MMKYIEDNPPPEVASDEDMLQYYEKIRVGAIGMEPWTVKGKNRAFYKHPIALALKKAAPWNKAAPKQVNMNREDRRKMMKFIEDNPPPEDASDEDMLKYILAKS